MSRPSGRHHHSSLQRERDETLLRRARVERAHRRAEQVGAGTPAATPADGTPARRSGTPAKVVIDNAVARRDPVTRPIPAVPGLPDARRSPSAPLPAHGRRAEAVLGAR